MTSIFWRFFFRVPPQSQGVNISVNAPYIFQAYSDWETLRENVLKFELEEFNKKKRLEEVEKKKKELEEEEQEIFFFDNEDAIDLEIEKKRARLPKSKPKSVISIDYVPPEITVKKSWVE